MDMWRPLSSNASAGRVSSYLIVSGAQKVKQVRGVDRYNKAMPSHVASREAWERMVTAVEKVRDRSRRAAQALEEANIPYAIAGGNAVAVHVAEIDEAAVRNTQDVGVLIRRADL